MTGPLTVADWLRAGGIGTGAYVVLAVLVKAAADTTRPAGPARTARPQPKPEKSPVLEVPPRPAYPPSSGRHAGPAAPDETRLLFKGQPAWNLFAPAAAGEQGGAL